jgi:hypothetical protein
LRLWSHISTKMRTKIIFWAHRLTTWVFFVFASFLLHPPGLSLVCKSIPKPPCNSSGRHKVNFCLP